MNTDIIDFLLSRLIADEGQRAEIKEQAATCVIEGALIKLLDNPATREETVKEISNMVNKNEDNLASFFAVPSHAEALAHGLADFVNELLKEGDGITAETRATLLKELQEYVAAGQAIAQA